MPPKKKRSTDDEATTEKEVIRCFINVFKQCYSRMIEGLDSPSFNGRKQL
jgi:hypothetical protein